MKSLLLFSVALLGIAGVATAVPADAQSVAAVAAPAGSSTADFLCNLSQTTATALPGSNPAPALASTIGICGPCSQDICDNRNVGAFCKHPLMAGSGTCRNYNLYTCPADGTPRCECLSSGVPEP